MSWILSALHPPTCFNNPASGRKAFWSEVLLLKVNGIGQQEDSKQDLNRPVLRNSCTVSSPKLQAPSTGRLHAWA